MNDSALFYLGKIPILTNILQTGEFNHHVVFVNCKFCTFSPAQAGCCTCGFCFVSAGFTSPGKPGSAFWYRKRWFHLRGPP